MNHTINGRVIDGEVQPWGGACRCRKCFHKTRREGFYVAPSEDRMAGEEERKVLNDYVTYKAENTPLTPHFQRMLDNGLKSLRERGDVDMSKFQR